MLMHRTSEGGSHVPRGDSHRGQVRVESDVDWTALNGRAALGQAGVGRQEIRTDHAWARIVRLDIAAHLLGSLRVVEVTRVLTGRDWRDEAVRRNGADIAVKLSLI